MTVIRPLHQDNTDQPEFHFHCPGCGYGHWFKTTGGHPRWTWNGDFDKPTVHPSILVNQSTPEARCHSFVLDGKIQFLGDCFHKLKGQTVPLPDLDDDGDPLQTSTIYCED